MSRSCFRVNPVSIAAWISRNSLLETDISFYNSNRTRTHNHLVHKQTLSRSSLSSYELPRDIQATIECGFTLKRVRDMIRIYSEMHGTDKCLKHSSVVWPVWLDGWVFVYQLCGSGSSTVAVTLSKISPFNSFMTEVSIIWKPVHWFAEQISNQWTDFYMIGTSVIKELKRRIQDLQKYLW